MPGKLSDAIQFTWRRVTGKLMGVPNIELTLTNDHNSGCASVDWWRKSGPPTVRINPSENGPGQLLPMDKNGNRLPEDLLLNLLHLGAHAAGTRTMASEGRYHDARFAENAKVLGLETVERGSASWSPATGFAIDFEAYADPDGPAWQELRRLKWYKRELEKLETLREWEAPAAIRPRQRGPVFMRCACTEETIKAGLRKRGLPEDTGIGTRGTKTIAAPKVINVSSGVGARGGILCADCGQPFELGE